MKAHYFTAVGQRPNNEDAVLIDKEFYCFEADGVAEGVHLAAVFDGLGGEPRGEEASKIAARVLAKTYVPGMSEELFLKALLCANENVISLATSPSDAPMTTMVGIVELEEGLYAFNLGDSISLQFRDDHLRQISVDDCTTPGMYSFGGRASSYITRCLGFKALHPGEIHLMKLDAKPGDVILITSDGITGAVDFRTMESLLSWSSPGEGQFRAIIEKAEEKGPSDNYSLVLLEC